MKSVSLLLASALCIGLLAACGGQETPAVQETLTRPASPPLKKVTMYYQFPFNTEDALLAEETYNEKGWRVDSVGYEYNAGVALERASYTYDARGNIVQEALQGANAATPYLTKSYEYNAQNQLVAHTEAYADGNREVYTYNEMGDPIEVRALDAAGNTVMTRRWEYKYDVRKRVLSEREFVDGEPSYVHLTKYRDHERMARKEFYVQDRLQKYYVYQYDSAGRLTERQEFKGDDTLFERRIKEYNAYGELSKSVILSGGVGNLLASHTYEYDAYGNVTTVHYEGKKNRTWVQKHVVEYWDDVPATALPAAP